MASPVNRSRRRKAFERGHTRPQGPNPYRNAILSKLWTAGREKRLAQTGGIMPPPPPSAASKRRPNDPPPRPGSRGSDRGGPNRGGGGGGSSDRRNPGRGRW